MDAVITVGNKTATLVSQFPEVYKGLDALLAIRVDGYQFTPSFRNHTWDGKHHFFKKLSGKFPSGLLNDVVDYLKDNNFTHSVHDDRKRPLSLNPICTKLQGIDLRPYQMEAADKIISKEQCIVKAATNSGKTEIAAEVIRRLNLPTTFIVHRKELLHQTAERLSQRLGVRVGRIGDGVEDVRPINVVMPQTAIKSVKGATGSKLQLTPTLQFLANADVLILDECHNYPDGRISYLINQSTAFYRFAMSGTPLMNKDVDNYALRGAFGDVAFEITNSELIQMGVSSVPICYFYKVNHPGIERAPYTRAYTEGIANSFYRNGMILSLAEVLVSEGKNVLVIVREKLHGQRLIERLVHTKSQYIHGSLSSDTRQAAIKKFKAGQLKCLVSTVILDEGVDISNIDVLILAAGGKAPKRVLQRIGRGLRKKESNQLTVIDFLDIGNLYLLEHSQSRVNTMREEGFQVYLL